MSFYTMPSMVFSRKCGLRGAWYNFRGAKTLRGVTQHSRGVRFSEREHMKEERYDR
jgi:hypothetical protein